LNSYLDLPVLYAFVIFDDIDDRLKCKKKLNSINFLEKSKNRFLDKHKLKAVNPPNPSIIIWENLECGIIETIIWWTIVNIIVVIILIFSFLLIFFLKWCISIMPDLSNCELEDNITGADFSSADTTQKERDCYCSELGIFKIPSTSLNWKWCHMTFWYTILRYLAVLGISSMITFINVMLKNILRRLSKFERYKNVSQMNSAIMLKLFLALFINIWLLIVAINADFSWTGIPDILSG